MRWRLVLSRGAQVILRMEGMDVKAMEAAREAFTQGSPASVLINWYEWVREDEHAHWSWRSPWEVLNG